MIEIKLEQMVLPVSLAKLGCGKSLSIECDGHTTKFNLRLRDTVRFLICRWSHEPGVSIGIPIVAGVPMEQIQELAKTRLQERYATLSMPWPGQGPTNDLVETPGNN